MERGEPSVTALGAAVQRAIHQLVDGEPKVLIDPVVVRLVEAVAPGAIEEGLQLPARSATFVRRSRFAEDELAAAAARGVRQYVILGAGLDTFAYRQPPYAGALRLFEVDHPATQAWKRAGLAAARLPLPPNLRWVPLDFERQTLPEALTAAGFDGTRPACFSWLGVTQYLTRAAVVETLRFVAGRPPQSTIVLTFVPSDEALAADQRARKHQVMQRVAALGEPWVTSFHPDELRAVLHDLGFSRVFHLTPDEADARYHAGRLERRGPPPLEQLLSATV